MTFGEFVKAMKAFGVRDDDVISFIDITGDYGLDVYHGQGGSFNVVDNYGFNSVADQLKWNKKEDPK